jgi:uncharacterized protein DUF3883
MANEDIVGTPWTDDELDAIVEDYFNMLEAELVGKPYVKSLHNETLRQKIQRSRGSVEYKHQNISAVLAELGMDWLRGYKPAINFQNALFDAIDRYLSRNQGLMEQQSSTYRAFAPNSSVFVPPPTRILNERKPPRLNQLIRKFDPVERDRLNRALGRAGEEFVLDVERNRLTKAGLEKLARNVRWISDQEGDGAGYDILSFDQSGQKRLIEVKTTNGAATTPFFLSRNEHSTAAAHAHDWRLYRVHCFSRDPRIFEIAPPLEDSLILQTETWRASFSA